MAFTNTTLERVTVGNDNLSQSNSISAASRVSLDETIADSTTDGAVGFTLDISAVKSFYMVSDQDILVEPNDGSTPDDPISLVAGIPYVWYTDKYDAFWFGTDITVLYITNASGSAANLKIEALVDPTP